MIPPLVSALASSRFRNASARPVNVATVRDPDDVFRSSDTWVDHVDAVGTTEFVTPPYEQSGANIAFWTLFGLFALGEYAIRFRSRFNRDGRRVERWSLLVVVAAVVGGLLGGLRVTHWHGASIGAASWPLFVVGLTLMATGVFVRQWAIFVLGRFFTVDVRVHRDQTVVDRGPYRWVRHPSYTGLVVFFVGVGLALSNWASLIVLTVVPTLGLLVRIYSEERALLAGLGEEYRRYAATRPRLFPGIW
jgi:protein-S-isoprenylcysteine O-methyltransferase Ste14